MITETRKGFKKAILQVVLWLVMIAMAIGYLPMILDRTMRSSCAVEINGQEIGFNQFASRLQHERERMEMFRQRFGPQADMYLSMFGMDNPEKNAYDGLVQDTLIDQAAQNAYLAVDHGLVARKLIDPQFIMSNLINIVPPYVIDPATGIINGQALHQYLAQRGMRQEEFDNAVERAVRANTLMGLVASTIYVDPIELKNLYERTSLGRAYGIITLPLSAYVQKVESAGVSDETLRSFLKAEAGRYMVPEKRTGDVWQFSPSSFGIAVTEDQAKAHYERVKHKQYVESPAQFQYRSIVIAKDPKDGITDAVRERAEKVAELIKKDPAQFAHLAKEYSEDKKAAAQGGLSAWLTREEIQPELRKALFALKEDGNVSELFTTKDGLEIVQRVGRKPIQFKSFEAVKDAIIARLVRNEFQNAFEREAKQVIRQGNAQALEQFIAQKGATKQVYADVERKEDAVVRALFTTKQGDWQAALSGDNGVLVHVTQVTKRHEPPFESVKDVVKKEYIEKEAHALLEADLKKAAVLAKEMPLTEVARTLAGTYQVTPMLTQESQAELEKLTAAGIPATRLLELTGKGAHESFLEGKHGYFAQVTEVEPFNEAQFEEKKEALAEQLYQEEIARAQRSLVASLYRNATLKLSDQINLQPKA